MPLLAATSPLKIAAILALVTLAPTSASAGGGKTYADSFGNLVVYSPAGYKRIVVAQGHLADRIAHHHGRRQHVYLEERGGERYLRKQPCRYGKLVHGRSYMYGLPENAVPVLKSCR